MTSLMSVRSLRSLQLSVNICRTFFPRHPSLDGQRSHFSNASCTVKSSDVTVNRLSTVDKKLVGEFGSLIYQAPGDLQSAILPIKIFSLLSSTIGFAAVTAMLWKSSAAPAFPAVVLASCVIVPFCLCTPLLLNWLTRRLAIELFYNDSQQAYTAIIYSLLGTKNFLRFKSTDVHPPAQHGIFASVTIGRRAIPLLVFAKFFTDVDHCALFTSMETYGVEIFDENTKENSTEKLKEKNS